MDVPIATGQRIEQVSVKPLRHYDVVDLLSGQADPHWWSARAARSTSCRA